MQTWPESEVCSRPVAQELVEQGKAISVRMEQLHHSTNLLQAAQCWASEAVAAIEGLPSLAQVLSSYHNAAAPALCKFNWHALVPCSSGSCLNCTAAAPTIADVSNSTIQTQHQISTPDLFSFPVPLPAG